MMPEAGGAGEPAAPPGCPGARDGRSGREARLRPLLLAYLDCLYRAAGDLNLTRIPRAQAWERHVLESLAVLDAAPIPRGADVVDLGSGAGVPGIPLAIARPDLHLVLLEKSPRKGAFLAATVAELGLPRVRVVVAGATPGGAPGVAPADLVVSRACAGPVELVRLAMPLLRPGGRLLAHVGASARVTPALRQAARAAGGGPPVIQAVPPVRLLGVRRR